MMFWKEFWNGFYVWFFIQFIFILLGKWINNWSWWIILIPTFLIVLTVILFGIYFWITCNPRIESIKKQIK